MRRRKLLVGVGSLTAGSAVLGTGAFSSVSAGRSVAVNVAGDDAALLALSAADSPNGEGAYAEQVAGQLTVHLDGENTDGSGVNPDAVTNVERVLTVQNQGTQGVGVYLRKEGEYPETVTFETHDDSTALGVDTADPTPEETVDLGTGDSETVDIRVDTTGLDVDPETALLDAVTFYADASTFGGSSSTGGSGFPRIEQTGRYGSAVAVDGDLAAVGAHAAGDGSDSGLTGQGLVHTYDVDGGQLTEPSTITVDETDVDQFGYDVAMDGNLLVVGAPSNTSRTSSEPGAVYVYKREGSGWSQVQRFDGESADGAFGYAVDVDGSTGTIVVSNTSDDQTDNTVYVYDRESEETWAEPETFVGASAAEFGGAVAVDGGTLVVGAVGGGTLFQGAVYIYESNGSGWTPTTSHTGDASFTFLGESVAVADGTALVGATGTNTVSIYERATGWSTSAAAQLSGDVGFGQSVAIADDALLVGADDAAAATLYAADGSGGWQSVETYEGGTTFGGSVALSETVALVGATPADTPGSVEAFEY